jgi:ankyrin repeat protein
LRVASGVIYLVFAVSIYKCSGGEGQIIERLSDEAYRSRAAVWIKHTDGGFFKDAPGSLEEMFVTSVEAGTPFQLWDRIVDVNGKVLADEWVARALRGMCKVKVRDINEKERTFDLEAPFPKIAVFHRTDFARKALSSAPRDARWNKDLALAVLALNSELDLAETAFARAKKNGFPAHVLGDYLGATILMRRRQFAASAALARKGIAASEGELIHRFARIEYWATTLSGGNKAAPANEAVPAGTLEAVRKDYASLFDAAMPSADKLATMLVREPYLGLCESNETRGFGPALKERLQRTAAFALQNTRLDGQLVGTLKPAVAALEFSAQVVVKPASTHSIYFTRHFTIGFLPIRKEEFGPSIRVNPDEGFFGVSFQDQSRLIFCNPYPELSGLALLPDLWTDFNAGKPHALRMILAGGAFEVFLDEKSVYRTPIGSELQSFIPVFRAQGMDFDIKQVNIQPLTKAAGKTPQAVVDVNAKLPRGDTRLHSACQQGTQKLLETLLAEGADINSLDNLGRTPAEAANDHFQDACAKYLMEKGTTKTLQLAIAYGTLEEVKSFCEKDPAALKKTKGMSPLHTAIKRKDAAILQVLLEKGADVNSVAHPMYGGMSAATFAVLNANTPALKTLLEKGALVNTKDSSGKTTLDWAKEVRAADDVIQLLQKYSKPIAPPKPPAEF